MKLGTVEFYELMNGNWGQKFRNFGNFEEFGKVVIFYETLYWEFVLDANLRLTFENSKWRLKFRKFNLVDFYETWHCGVLWIDEWKFGVKNSKFWKFRKINEINDFLWNPVLGICVGYEFETEIWKFKMAAQNFEKFNLVDLYETRYYGVLSIDEWKFGVKISKFWKFRKIHKISDFIWNPVLGICVGYEFETEI